LALVKMYCAAHCVRNIKLVRLLSVRLVSSAPKGTRFRDLATPLLGTAGALKVIIFMQAAGVFAPPPIGSVPKRPNNIPSLPDIPLPAPPRPTVLDPVPVNDYGNPVPSHTVNLSRQTGVPTNLPRPLVPSTLPYHGSSPHVQSSHVVHPVPDSSQASQPLSDSAPFGDKADSPESDLKPYDSYTEAMRRAMAGETGKSLPVLDSTNEGKEYYPGMHVEAATGSFEKCRIP
jgi:hypothetical protein